MTGAAAVVSAVVISPLFVASNGSIYPNFDSLGRLVPTHGQNLSAGNLRTLAPAWSGFLPVLSMAVAAGEDGPLAWERLQSLEDGPRHRCELARSVAFEREVELAMALAKARKAESDKYLVTCKNSYLILLLPLRCCLGYRATK